MFNAFIRGYWEYYRELEDEFLATRRYVAFDVENYSTYSVEYLKLYLAVCGEIDTVGKDIAHAVNGDFEPDNKKNNIYKWWFEIQSGDWLGDGAGRQTEVAESYSLFSQSCTFLGRWRITPWAEFEVERPTGGKGGKRYSLVLGKSLPSWWSSYNSIKHNRTRFSSNQGKVNYSEANLGNLINAFAGLYILESSYMEFLGTTDDIESFADESRLFVEKKYVTSSDVSALF